MHLLQFDWQKQQYFIPQVQNRKQQKRKKIVVKKHNDRLAEKHLNWLPIV